MRDGGINPILNMIPFMETRILNCMKYIPDHLKEFDLFPWIVGFMVFLGLVFAFIKRPGLYLTWFILMALIGIAGMYDFYLWEYDYGHDLDPKAIMKFTNPDGSIMGFQPPLFGSKDILNFTAHSYPRLGAYSMFIGMTLTFIAFLMGKKEAKKA